MTLERRKPLARTVGLNPRNRKRRKAAHARNFGDEADAVRAMPCLCWGKPATGRHPCRGDVQAAHVTARGGGGAKGGRFDIVPLCAAHHLLACEARTEQRREFERLFQLDLRAEADRIALEHPSPLGLRGVAADYASVGFRPQTLNGNRYDLDALLGWVRRDIERSAAAFMRGWNRAIADGVRPDADGTVLAREQALRWMAASLTLNEAAARALLAAAGVDHA